MSWNLARLAGADVGGRGDRFRGRDEVEVSQRTPAWRILDAETNLHVDPQDALWMEIDP